MSNVFLPDCRRATWSFATFRLQTSRRTVGHALVGCQWPGRGSILIKYPDKNVVSGRRKTRIIENWI